MIVKKFQHDGHIDQAIDTPNLGYIQNVRTGFSSTWAIRDLRWTENCNSGSACVLTQASSTTVAHTVTPLGVLAVPVAGHDYPSVCIEHDTLISVQEIIVSRLVHRHHKQTAKRPMELNHGILWHCHCGKLNR